MASGRITIRIPETLGERLRRRSRMKGQPESALVREALETYLGQSAEPRPACELAEEAGLIGCIGRGRKSLSKDLSTARDASKALASRSEQKCESPGSHPGLILDAVCKYHRSASSYYVKLIYHSRVTGGGRGTRTLVAG